MARSHSPALDCPPGPSALGLSVVIGLLVTWVALVVSYYSPLYPIGFLRPRPFAFALYLAALAVRFQIDRTRPP